MTCHKTPAGRCAAIAGLCMLLAAGALTARATPTMDGAREAEYTLVSSSPKDNLYTGDSSEPKSKSLDAANLYAANTGSALYVYVELPYLDLNAVYGEWAIVMHLKGANDAIEILTPVQDPYMSQNPNDAAYRSVEYGHAPGPNAVIKSNFRGFPATSDGNQGYAFTNVANLGATGWNFPNGNFFASGAQGWVNDTATGTIHGYGNSGAEIVYKGGAGIEMLIPLALFGADYPNNSGVQAPVIGDELLMQFYDNLRQPNDATVRYPRGPIDAVPYQDGLHADPAYALLDTYGSYTLKPPAAFDVIGADAPSPTRVSVLFSDAAGTGTGTAANYAVTNVATGATVAVTAAAVDPGNPARVNLTTAALSPQTTYKVKVSNVSSGSGTAVSAKNSVEFKTTTLVVFNLYDPQGMVAALGDDIDTGKPYTVSIVGTMNGWKDDGGAMTGAGEIPTHLVSGETPAHYQSDPLFVAPGLADYKWRIPGRGNYLNWDTLQPPSLGNRRAWIPITGETVQVNDTAFNYDHHGAPVMVTFILHDLDNRANGGRVQVAGAFNSWAGGVDDGYTLAPVEGQPNTYKGTIDIGLQRPEFAQGSYFLYKFIVKPDPDNNPDATNWDLFGAQDRYLVVNGTGDPLAQTVEVYVGGQLFQRALRVAGGLEPAPSIGDPFAALDRDVDGRVTVRDVPPILAAR